MRSIPVTHPRRRPRQARAQATVEAIIQATARVLVNEGYDRASTNRIAQAAGVSIGSLYQYFPSKEESLVAALVEEHVTKMTRALMSTLEQREADGLAESARHLSEGLVAAYRVDAELHNVLCQEVPKIGELQEVYGFERKIGALVREHLSTRRHQLRVKDLDRAVFVMVNAVPSVIRAAVRLDPEGNQDTQLVSDTTDLMLRYLMSSPPTAVSRGLGAQNNVGEAQVVAMAAADLHC